MNNSKLTSGLLALLLVALVAALYGPFRWNPIIFDDIYFFLLDRDGNQPVSSYHFALLELRSLPYATLAWTKLWFGLDLIYFRIGNLALHAAVVLALFAFLAALFSHVYGKDHKGVQNGLPPLVAAFFAALLFALHPVASYAAGYLVQRSIVMATLFSLLSLMVYVQGSVGQKPFWLWLSVPLYYLGVFSKEHAIMLPAVLAALTVLLHDDWRDKLKQRWGIFVALAGVAGVVVLVKRGLLGSVYELNAADMLPGTQLAYPLSIITQAWLFFKYAFLWIFPNPAWMSIDMREPFALELFSPYLLALAGFAAWGAASVWLLSRRGIQGLAGFALLFPWLMFLTEFSTVRVQEIFVLYRSYLWAVGAFCLLPVLFIKVKSRSASFVLSLVALAMFPISMERLMTLSQPVLVWDDAEKLVKGRPDLPGAYRIYYNRGTDLMKIDNMTGAIADLKQCIALNPGFVEAYNNLGAAYFNISDWSGAVAAHSRAIELSQSNGKAIDPRYFLSRAQSYEKMGEFEKAQSDYQESCRRANRGCDKLK
jgi:tetratricopeptide (TPR) repeat protein